MAKIMNRNKRNSTEHLQNPATWKYRRERFWVDREVRSFFLNLGLEIYACLEAKSIWILTELHLIFVML